MTAYTTAAAAQTTFHGEIGALLAAGSQVDPVRLLRPVLGETVDVMARAIRHVRMGELERGRVRFAKSPYPTTTARQAMERRFFALLLMILGEARGTQARAWTKRLWRGRRERWEVNPDDGELKRVYVSAKRKDGTSGAQAGLAGRLGCSVREVDRYLQVARAAGIVGVWQGPTRERAEQKKGHFEGGRKYAFAVFQWLAELPVRVRDRIRGRQSALDRSEAPATHASASAPAESAAWGASYGGEAESALEALKRRPIPPH